MLAKSDVPNLCCGCMKCTAQMRSRNARDIAEEAGAKVTAVDGSVDYLAPLTIIVATPGIYEQVKEQLK